MPGILSNNTNGNKFKTVLGLSPFQIIHHTVDTDDDDSLDPTTSPRSLPPTTPAKPSRGRRLRGRIPLDHKRTSESSTPTMPSTTIDSKPLHATAARPVRLDGEGGFWTISVAPVSSRIYTIYIKTPTHHLTLTRSANEITHLHAKIQDHLPNGSSLPQCPLESEPPQKRKSSFLTTLSRLASPPRSSSHLDDEPSDAFLAAEPSSTSALAAYLTTLANEKSIRDSRAWKRFVRVRTDDLESTRVERAIKRVRSDIAKHTSNGSAEFESLSRTMMDGKNASTSGAAERSGQDDEDEGFLASTLTPDDASARETARRLIDSGLMDFTSPTAPPIATRIIQRDTTPATTAAAVAPTPISPVDVAKEQEHAEVPPQRQPYVPSSEPLEPEQKQPAREVEPVPVKTEERQEEEQAIVDESPQKEEAVGGPVEEVAEATAQVEPASAVGEPAPMEAIQDKLARVWEEQEYDSPIPPTQSETEATDAEDTDAFGGAAMSDTGAADTTDEFLGEKLKKKKKKKQKLERKARKVRIDDFEMMRVLGKGCAGKVLLVKYKRSDTLYALKAITKRHVLAHQELQHTLTEQAVLKRMARSNTDPFVVKLYWSFHDKENLFLVMDFHPGGDLATQLARWGRLGRDRARFYAAEIVEGVEGLHAAGVIYRDLKPENILIGGDGHIVLTDFGLSKEFQRRRPTSLISHDAAGNDFYASSPATPTGENHNTPHWMNGGSYKDSWLATKANDTTTTFCGTAEYLAPEVIQGLPYSYEVDWWSFGTMLYEMLTGITPFWANNHSDMYVRVLQDELAFPEDKAMDHDTKSLIRGLLQRNPALRLCEPRIKKHPYFSMIDWQHVFHKRYIPPYIPPIDPANASDTQNFDDAFLEMEPILDSELENDDQTGSERDRSTTDIETRFEEEASPANGDTSVAQPEQEREPEPDVFDGYSFKARHSVIIDDDDGHEGSDESDADESILAKTAHGHEEEHELEGGQKTPEANSKPSTPTPASAVIEAFRRQQEEQRALTAITSESRPENEHEKAAEREEADVSSPITPKNKVDDLPSEEASVKAASTASVDKDLPAPPSEPYQPVSEAVPAPATPPKASVGSAKPEKEKKTVTISEKPEKPKKAKAPRNAKPTRRERSGVAALDRDLSDVLDEEEGPMDHEEDDWDFVEAPGFEDFNGRQEKSLFARGVVDRYRLKVFRKPSTPALARPPQQRNPSSSQSGPMLTDSEFGELPSSATSPTEKKKNRSGGLSLRKPRTFLRPKSPSATYSAGSSKLTRPGISTQHSATISGSTSGILRTPSATTPLSALPPNGSMSLKSHPSMNSMGSPGSSDNSVNGNEVGMGSLTQSATELATSPSKNRGNKSSPDLRRQAKEQAPDVEEARNRPLTKMRKYTEQGAEKVMSLFSSPRPSPSSAT